jgi:hypothetical protein
MMTKRLKTFSASTEANGPQTVGKEAEFTLKFRNAEIAQR